MDMGLSHGYVGSLKLTLEFAQCQSRQSSETTCKRRAAKRFRSLLGHCGRWAIGPHKNRIPWNLRSHRAAKATAVHHNLTIVSRNVSDFTDTQVPVVNPWEP